MHNYIECMKLCGKELHACMHSIILNACKEIDSITREEVPLLRAIGGLVPGERLPLHAC